MVSRGNIRRRHWRRDLQRSAQRSGRLHLSQAGKPLSPTIFGIPVVKHYLLPLMLTAALFAEAPWGKDADLIPQSRHSRRHSSSPTHSLILSYQRTISPTCGPRSHFSPTSSEYMRQAIVEWGAGMGYLLGCDRLLRENSEEWLYRRVRRGKEFVKWDPPPKRSLPSQR